MQRKENLSLNPNLSIVSHVVLRTGQAKKKRLKSINFELVYLLQLCVRTKKCNRTLAEDHFAKSQLLIVMAHVSNSMLNYD